MYIESEKLAHLFSKRVFVFGHCNASLKLIDFLENNGINIIAILDNSDSKQGVNYKGIKVVPPKDINKLVPSERVKDSAVLIVSRHYAAMSKQLCALGYKGLVYRVADYNTYANFSLSEDTISKMHIREQNGEKALEILSNRYPKYFRVFFPFNALGDVYLAMAYWSAFSRMRNIDKVVFCMSSISQTEVVRMFGDYSVEIYTQEELDSMIQATLYTRDKNSFIAHHDRPYVLKLHKALYNKRIPIEKIYCCGVYGLPLNTIPTKPDKNLKEYSDIESIQKGKTVIFSPYAKSVIPIELGIWEKAVGFYSDAGYKCFTNVVGDEVPLPGTDAISPSLFEMKSVVEKAGTFVGIRSGLCDVIREAKAKKIALYPDYNYCDTKWKAIEMYWINQFDYNLLATEEIKWETL